MELAGQKRARLVLGVVVLFALGVSWEAGRRGFMPLDQSVVFDGGWRMLSGQVPWRDFDAPSFITPSAIQALFFGAFGVSWWSYLLHAMLANAVFAALVLFFGRRLGLGEACAVALALGSAVIFYPPIGTPFADQEAFLFTFAALVCAWLARNDSLEVSCWRPWLLWALVPFLLALGFFSKQLPAALAPLPVALILAMPAARPRREGWLGLVLGLLLLGAAAVLLCGVFQIDPGRVYYDLFELPLGEAELRRGYLPKQPLGLVARFWSAGLVQGLFVVWFIHLGSLLVAVRELWLARTGRLRLAPLGLVVFGELLLQMDVVTLVLTNNQDGAGVAWFFLAAAPVLAGLRFSFAGAERARVALRFGTWLLIATVALDAGRFHLQVNRTRSVNDMDFALAEAPPAGASLPMLAPLRWTTPEHHGFSLADFARLVTELRGRPGEFFLVGDSALLYGLVGSRSMSPALWFHPGVSFPRPGSADFRTWQQPLVAAVEDGTLARIVEERAGTWIGNLHLEDFPRVARAVRARGFESQDFGAFRVLELAPLPQLAQ